MPPNAAASVAAPLSSPAGLLEALGDAFIATDLECRVTIGNAAAEQLSGYTAKAAIGRPACALSRSLPR